MSYFDSLCIGYIEFNDINVWLKDYGVDFKVAVKQGDDEDRKAAEMNVEPKAYKVEPEKDYFRKCPTILNSEKAALKVAEELFQACMKTNKRWFDKDFGPKTEAVAAETQSDEYKTECSIACYGKPDEEKAGEIVWKAPRDYLEEGGDTVEFVKNDASSNEVKQGECGDCWFIGALSVISTRDNLLRGGLENVEVTEGMKVSAYIASQMSSGVYAPIFHKYRTKGIYVLRFFKDFAWRYVLIDERLPINVTTNEPVFAQCTDPTEMWVNYIEKAFAKLFGSYAVLASGFLDDGVCDMTGLVCEKLVVQGQEGEFLPEGGDTDAFWKYLFE